jgi:hypothetical protein
MRIVCSCRITQERRREEKGYGVATLYVQKSLEIGHLCFGDDFLGLASELEWKKDFDDVAEGKMTAEELLLLHNAT